MNKSDLIGRIFHRDDREAWVLNHEIARFNETEKRQAEELLLEMLGDCGLCFLAFDALSVLQSTKAVSYLYSNIANVKLGELRRLVLTATLFRAKQDHGLVGQAISLFRSIGDQQTVVLAMNYLATIRSPETAGVIEEYSRHSDKEVATGAAKHLKWMQKWNTH